MDIDLTMPSTHGPRGREFNPDDTIAVTVNSTRDADPSLPLSGSTTVRAVLTANTHTAADTILSRLNPDARLQVLERGGVGTAHRSERYIPSRATLGLYQRLFVEASRPQTVFGGMREQLVTFHATNGQITFGSRDTVRLPGIERPYSIHEFLTTPHLDIGNVDTSPAQRLNLLQRDGIENGPEVNRATTQVLVAVLHAQSEFNGTSSPASARGGYGTSSINPLTTPPPFGIGGTDESGVDPDSPNRSLRGRSTPARNPNP